MFAVEHIAISQFNSQNHKPNEVCMLIHAKLYTSAGLLLLFVFFVTFTLNSCKEQTPSSIEPGKLPP